MGNADQIDADLVRQAVARLRGRDDRLSVCALAEQLGVSEGKLKQAFKTITGLTVAQFTRALKAQLLRDSLQQGMPATDAIFEAGYGSLSRVYEHSDKLLGMSPARYKDKGSMESIEYTVTTSDLGELLVAWTSKGVVCILLGDAEPELEKLLHKRFSKAEIIRTTAGETVKDIVKQIADPAKEVDLPLDIRGTAFQEQVWQALRDIPAGKTQTYQDVANNIGQPRAVRAVANACGANKLPVVIPCHRVVRSDGQVGGYAFGTARKKELLRRESESGGPT